LALGSFTLFVASCGSSPSSGSGSSNTTTTAAQAEPGIGTPVKAGDFTLTVNSAAPTSSGNQYITPTNDQFLLVQVTIENNTSSSKTISSLLQFDLRDDTGQKYTLALVTGTPATPDGEVAAGSKLAGGLTYDVPTGRTFTLMFKPSLLGKTVSVNLGRH